MLPRLSGDAEPSRLLPRSCCGLLDLRQGSMIIGVCLVVVNSLSAVGGVILWTLLGTDGPSDPARPAGTSEPTSVIVPIAIATLALAAVHIAFNALLVFGARRERSGVLLAWLVYQAFSIAVSLAGVVTMLVFAARLAEPALVGAGVATLVGLAVMAYWFTVVLALRCQVRRKESTTVALKPVEMVPIA